jgi:hypothetical protein
MEALFETKSIPALLTLIAVFMCASFIRGCFEIFIKLKKEKESASEAAILALTEEVKRNTLAMEHLDDKLSLDIRRMFSALKLLAGDRWQQIRKDIMENDL